STDAFLHSPAPPAPYTLSLPDALPIFPHILLRAQPVLRWSAVLRPHVCRHSLRQSVRVLCRHSNALREGANVPLLHGCRQLPFRDRKSTRLNSSHVKISYAVFCLKKKK